MKNLVVFICLLILGPSFSFAQVSKLEFETLQNAMLTEFSGDLKNSNSRLVINKSPGANYESYWWDLDMVRASYSTYVDENNEREHLIFVFGGMARMPGMTMDHLALTMCHELGHGLAGEPFKQKGPLDPKTTVEGMADYYAARDCFPRILKHLPEPSQIMAPSLFTQNLCDQAYTSEAAQIQCYRGFMALEVEREFYRTQMSNEPETNYETPDQTVVDETNLEPTHYPSTQCRLDTLVAGLLKKPAPKCWFR